MTRDMDKPQPRRGVFKQNASWAYIDDHENLIYTGQCPCYADEQAAINGKVGNYDRVAMDEEFALTMAKSFGDRSHDGFLFSEDGSLLLLNGQYDTVEAAIQDTGEMMLEMDSRACDMPSKWSCWFLNDFDCTDHFPTLKKEA